MGLAIFYWSLRSKSDKNLIQNLTNNHMKIPRIGKCYHFWVDGKSSTAHHYVCKCERIVIPSQARYLKINESIWDNEQNAEIKETNLYDIWQENVKARPWLYSERTDYLIECSCPQFDNNHLWFVRTVDDKFFSLNIQSSHQSGLLELK